MATSRIDLLRRMPTFGGMKEEALALILDQSTSCGHSAGEFFFREGDRADSVYVLESGRVVVLRDLDGRPIRLGHLGKGDCFGEMSMIDFQARSASVKAETPCHSIKIPAGVLRSLYQHDLEQYAIIMMNLGREVSRRLRKADDRLFRLYHGQSVKGDNR